MAEKKYISAEVKTPGSWNPDAGIDSIGDNEFSEVRNLRQVFPGDYELRSGYSDTTGFDYGTLGDDAEILCSCEYKFVADDNTLTLFDVVAYFDNDEVKLYAINRSPIVATPNPSIYWALQFERNVLRNADDSADLAIPFTPTDDLLPVRAFMVQYGSYIALTVYGLGVFAIYPAGTDVALTIVAPDAWVVRSLGKDRADAPADLPTFADTHNGDLFIVLVDDTVSDNPGGGTLGIRFTHNVTPKKLLAGQLPTSIFPPLQYIRVPLNAKYYNSKQTPAFDSGVVPGTTTGLRYWEFSDFDPPISNQDSRSATHLQTRAWGYRFVFVHKFVDGRGNTITYRSAPSTDIWVPNMIYCPPQLFAKGNPPVNEAGKRIARFLSFATTVPSLDVFPPTIDSAAFIFSSEYVANSEIPYPSVAAVQELGEAIIAYNAQSYQYKNNASVGTKWSTGATNMDENTFLGAMYWTGFWRFWRDATAPLSEQYNFNGDIKIPYFCEVPANELADAPLTKFLWSMFPDVPADVTEIEIYRTAFNESDNTIALDGIDQPLYQTHLYGYCGSLKAPVASEDPEFIDDVKDEELDFGNSPNDSNGLIAGDFSGAVIAEYNRHLVLGDIETSYAVLDPWDQYQVYIYGPGAGSKSDFKEFGGLNFFGLQYIDADANTSDVIELDTLGYTSSVTADTTWGNVAAVIPAGYDPFVTAIRFIYFDGTDYRIVKSVKPDDGYVLATYAECTAGAILPNGATGTGELNTKEPGSTIWTNPADIFTIAPLNYLLVHPSNAVTALHSIMGELYVFSRASVSLTNLVGRFEELNKELGCIGRFSSAKLDKIVFFLSASGLYFMEASGIVAFPGKVDNLVRGYLNEPIPDQALLSNGNRAAIGYLSKFRELWLYLPGSDDLGGALPARLIVYKFFGDLYASGAMAAIQQGFLNYEFELLTTGNPSYPSGVDNGSQSLTLPLIFTMHSDGSLYAEFKQEATIAEPTPLYHSINNDNGSVWLGGSAIEKPLPLGDPAIVKILRAVRHTGNAVGNVYIRCGAPRADGIPQYNTGLVWLPSTEYPYSVNNDGIGEMFNHRIPWDEIAQSTHETPIVRFRSEPNGSEHDVAFTGFTFLLDALHKHPD